MGNFLILISIGLFAFLFKKINQVQLPTKRKKYKLSIELVPSSMHGCNVRSRISVDQWKKICLLTHGRLKYQVKGCSICNENGRIQGFSHDLECHEKWVYDTETSTQKLVDLLSLCPMCHKVFHYGLSKKMGYGERAFKHLMKVNRITEQEANELIKQAEEDIKIKSKINWSLDLTYLNNPKYSFLKTKFTTNEKYNCNTSIEY